MNFDVISSVPANMKVYNGCADKTCTAPKEEGLYILQEVADNNNCHVRWQWIKDDGRECLATYKEMKAE